MFVLSELMVVLMVVYKLLNVMWYWNRIIVSEKCVVWLTGNDCAYIDECDVTLGQNVRVIWVNGCV